VHLFSFLPGMHVRSGITESCNLSLWEPLYCFLKGLLYFSLLPPVSGLSSHPCQHLLVFYFCYFVVVALLFKIAILMGVNNWYPTPPFVFGGTGV
jgi:hypothetical protein